MKTAYFVERSGKMYPNEALYGVTNVNYNLGAVGEIVRKCDTWESAVERAKGLANATDIAHAATERLIPSENTSSKPLIRSETFATRDAALSIVDKFDAKTVHSMTPVKSFCESDFAAANCSKIEFEYYVNSAGVEDTFVGENGFAERGLVRSLRTDVVTMDRE